MTTLNRYTKTILEFKYKRRNIEKSLLVQQKLMELELLEQVWDLYLTPPPNEAEPPSANGHEPPTGTVYVVEMDEVEEMEEMEEPSQQQREEYC